MRKLFLCTTILTAGLFATNAMSANNPKITIGGVADAQIAIVDQDDESDIADQDVIFRNDNEIHFSIDGKTDGGLEYGAVIELEADVGDEQDGGINADRTYVYLQGAKWGRIEFGSNDTAAQTLRLDADTFARGTGGIGGDAIYYISNRRQSFGHYFVKPSMSIGDTLGREGGDESNKITYYTPNFSGFQAGISYIPNLPMKGQGISGVYDWQNNISVAARYEKEWDNFGLGVFAGMDFEDYKGNNGIFVDRDFYNVGTKLSYADFTVGGSYAYSPEYAYETKEFNYFSLGATYANEQFGVGVGYFQSELDDELNTSGSDFKNLVFSADYNLAPGILPYAEVAIFEFDSDVVGADNEGTIVLLGTELTF